MSETYSSVESYGVFEIDEPKRYDYRITYKGDGINPQVYIHYGATLTSGEHVRTSAAASVFGGETQGNTKATNAALNKLYSKCQQAEGLRVAWLEREKSINLLISSTKMLVRVLKAMKRRDPKLLRAMLKKNPEASDVLKAPASTWLVYWFGLVPTIADIHHALGVFANPFPVVELDVTGGTNLRVDYGNVPQEYFAIDGTVMCKLGGTLTAISPHLDLASRLGFGQPLSVAYEMMAFSWLLDYFVNVGQLIKNLEPRFPGLEFNKQYKTYFGSGLVSYRIGAPYTVPERSLTTWDCFFMERTLGWPGYQPTITSPLELKLKQASYIVAVAIQLLTGMKKK